MSLADLKNQIRQRILARDPERMARELMDQGVVVRWLIYAIGALAFLVWLLIVTRNDRRNY
jgi:hypothetical protein